MHFNFLDINFNIILIVNLVTAISELKFVMLCISTKQILGSGLSDTHFKAEKSLPSVVQLSWRVSGGPFPQKLFEFHIIIFH